MDVSNLHTDTDITLRITVAPLSGWIVITAGLFGLISNIYVVTVIALHKPMHKQLTNIYITNQSVIDATVAFFLFFTTMFEDDKRKRTPGYGPDEAICRLWYTKVSDKDGLWVKIKQYWIELTRKRNYCWILRLTKVFCA